MTPDQATAGFHVLVDVPITFETEDGTTVHSPMIHATVGGVAIAGPPPFAGWGVGGFLSPQHLHPNARVLIDLLHDRLVVVESSGADVDAWLIARLPSLRPIAIDRVPGEATVAVPAAIEPFATVPTMLNTGGRQTEFASAAVSGLRGTGDEHGGTGVGGGRVLGSDAGERILRVGAALIPLSRLVVRDEMDGPAGLVGEDVLRGTALICSADPDRGVVWLIP